MFDFENKPVKDWTLEEAKEYCESKHGDKCYDSETEEELLAYCKLAKYNVCCEEPKYYNLNNIPEFTPDEIAFCRLIKKTYPWANYIAKGSMALMYSELRPVFTTYGYFEYGSTGRCTIIDYKFFPQIEPLTYYAINDIIKQGNDNNA